MQAFDDFNDEYVASILAKDAKADATRHGSRSTQGFLPQRPTLNAPKPNTRFLKTIIRETDTHNATLRAREARIAQERLRNSRQDTYKRESLNARNTSNRKLDTRESKRRRSSVHDDEEPRSRRRKRDRSQGHSDPSKYRDRRPRSVDLIAWDSYGDGTDSHRHHHRHRHRRHRSRSRRRRTGDREDSPDEPEMRTPGKSRYKYQEGPQREEKSSRSDGKANERRRHLHHRERDGINESGLDETAFPKSVPNPRRSSSTDSDPLNAIIGPSPPSPRDEIKARGRGALNAVSKGSAMDAHFASTYDPAEDAHPDPDVETDDWDQALEALRDRQKWQQRGAERLRAVGFSEDEVSKWTQGKSKGSTAMEKDEADVRWKGRGESREWDRGKIISEEGVLTEPEWGRLKGT